MQKSTTTVGDVHQRLKEYREKKEAERVAEEKRLQEQQVRLERNRLEQEERKNSPKQLSFLESSAVDLLDVWPMRKWRQFKEKYPFQCWVITGTVWLTGQLLAIHAEFGLVFTLFSLFLLMFLQLGVRAEGEMSAYSVFNPNCQRLLGQMTSEHFERDMLMQRKEDEEN